MGWGSVGAIWVDLQKSISKASLQEWNIFTIFLQEEIDYWWNMRSVDNYEKHELWPALHSHVSLRYIFWFALKYIACYFGPDVKKHGVKVVSQYNASIDTFHVIGLKEFG